MVLLHFVWVGGGGPNDRICRDFGSHGRSRAPGSSGRRERVRLGNRGGRHFSHFAHSRAERVPFGNHDKPHGSHFAHSRAERVPFGKSPGWAPAAAQTVRMRAPPARLIHKTPGRGSRPPSSPHAGQGASTVRKPTQSAEASKKGCHALDCWTASFWKGCLFALEYSSGGRAI